MVYKIGLTGAIGSGKSTAARIFAKLGATVLDADVLAKEALEDPAVQTDLKARFPSAFENGALSHKALADIVFSDRSRLAKLTELTHPVVRRKFKEVVSSMKEGVLVYDVPLLFEAGLEGDFDLTIVISTPDEIRHDRLKKRGLTEEDIKRREGLQLKPAEKENRADVVLTNAGAPEDLENAILKILESSRRALK